jgi:hypothetical protein
VQAQSFQFRGRGGHSHPTTRRLNVWEESDSQSGIWIQGGDGGDQWRSRGRGVWWSDGGLTLTVVMTSSVKIRVRGLEGIHRRQL